MSKSDVWMPLYIGDYLADTMRLTTLEHGAYMLLLMEYWRSGPLPDDDRALATIARVERKVWDREIGPALRRFFTKDGDVLRQKRMDTEREKMQRISNKRKAAAGERWGKDASSKGGSEPPSGASNSNANASAIGHATVDASDPNLQMLYAGVHPPASPSPTPKEEGSEATASGAAAPPDPPPSAADLLWREGVPILRHLTGKADGACRSLIGKLRRDARDDCPRVLMALQQARDMRPTDPVAWLMRAVEPRDAAGRQSAAPSKLGYLDAIVDFPSFAGETIQ